MQLKIREYSEEVEAGWNEFDLYDFTSDSLLACNKYTA